MLDLKELHKHFVITPVSNNIGIICKFFNLKIIEEEEVDNSGNFKQVSLSEVTRVKYYTALLQNKYNTSDILLPNLPLLYWIPKFHKNPVDFRFITSGRYTAANNLSKHVGVCLKNLLFIEKHHCKALHKFDEIKNYYIIDSNKEIIQFMVDASKAGGTIKNVTSYDFKTLYTNIPQHKLKGNLKIFISSIFKLKKKKYVTIEQKRSYFSDKTSKFCRFNENDIINQVNYLIDNCFIQYNKSVLQQVIGIPMGSNSATHMANIFLHIYEKAYIEHLIDEGNTDVIKNHGIPFRYQDDHIIFGNSYAKKHVPTRNGY